MFASPTSVNGRFSGRGSLSKLHAELTRQRDTKLDFVCDTRMIGVAAPGESFDDAVMDQNSGSNKCFHLIPRANTQATEFLPLNGMPLTETAFTQIGQRVTPEIPTRFLKELALARPSRAADLLCNLMLDTGNDGKDGKRNLIRTLDGQVRAYLNDRYRMVDHIDTLFTVLDAAREADARPVECMLTDSSFRIKLVNASVWKQLNDNGGHRPGQSGFRGNVNLRSRLDDPGTPPTTGPLTGVVSPMTCISNSETGQGGLYVETGMFDWACINGVIFGKAMRAVHLGEKMDIKVFSQETIQQDAKTILMKLRDVVTSSFKEESFNALCTSMNKASSDKIESPSTAVANLITNTALPDSVKDNLLAHFLRDYQPTRLGLVQALTRASQDIDDADLAYTLDSTAGRLVSEPALLKA